MIDTPSASFEAFLREAVAGKFIQNYRWTDSVSSAELKARTGVLEAGWSRTHKTCLDGRIWALEVQARPRWAVGVDLELVCDRPILANPVWLAQRFGLDCENLSPELLLEEWVSREAVFKALAPDNGHFMLSSFYKIAPGSYGVVDDAARTCVEVSVAKSDDYLIALARRKLL